MTAQQKLSGISALTTTAALLLLGSASGARAQNAETSENAPPPPHFTLGPITTPRVIVAEVWEGKVISVVDGSTLLVERAKKAVSNAGDAKEVVVVRLWGVAVPAAGETASAAKAFVQKSVEGKIVRVEAQTRAKNGDLLAEVFALPDKPRYGALPARLREINDPTSTNQPRPLTEPDIPAASPNLNEGLVRAGLARWDNATAEKATNLSVAQTDAQKNKVGIWADAAAAETTHEKSGTATSAEKPAEPLPRRP